jgi:hypothetical protein
MMIRVLSSLPFYTGERGRQVDLKMGTMGTGVGCCGFKPLPHTHCCNRSDTHCELQDGLGARSQDTVPQNNDHKCMETHFPAHVPLRTHNWVMILTVVIKKHHGMRHEGSTGNSVNVTKKL